MLNTDCLTLIFNELKDKKSLHSCLLVNREWCKIVAPILWKIYSWYNIEKSIFFIKTVNTILSCLPTSSKQLLTDNNIKLPSTIILEPPLFNYISFCEFPNFEVVKKITDVVLGCLDSDDGRINCFERVIYKLFVSQTKNVKVLIWHTSQPLSSFPGALTCFSQLNSLTINLNYVSSKSLYEMAKICKDLEFLEVRYFYHDLSGLTSLIDAQRNLKKVHLYTKKGTCEELSKALARKGNTINIFYLNLISTIPPSFLISLINLTHLSIYNDENHEFIDPEVNIFQQHLAISEFPNLQSLSVMGLSCFKELAILIGKTKGDIIRIHIDTTNRIVQNTGMLIKEIAKNCPKIEKLNTYLEPKDFNHVKSLLIKCRQLKEITFDSLNIFVNDIGEELFDIFTKYSPMTLIDISISSSWKCSIDGFELFFESCKERTLLNFNIIYNSKDYITEQHRDIVRRYINEGVIRYSNCN